jgi:hypothetical protein
LDKLQQEKAKINEEFENKVSQIKKDLDRKLDSEKRQLESQL